LIEEGGRPGRGGEGLALRLYLFEIFIRILAVVVLPFSFNC
jgi:hypothetical protein